MSLLPFRSRWGRRTLRQTGLGAAPLQHPHEEHGRADLQDDVVRPRGQLFSQSLLGDLLLSGAHVKDDLHLLGQVADYFQPQLRLTRPSAFMITSSSSSPVDMTC